MPGVPVVYCNPKACTGIVSDGRLRDEKARSLVMERQQIHIKLSADAEAALHAVMGRTGLNRSQAINAAIVNMARGHDGYYAQMAAFQSAIAAGAALFAALRGLPQEAQLDLNRFVINFAEDVHGSMPTPPDHIRDTAAQEPIARAFLAAIMSRYPTE